MTQFYSCKINKTHTSCCIFHYDEPVASVVYYYTGYYTSQFIKLAKQCKCRILPLGVCSFVCLTQSCSQEIVKELFQNKLKKQWTLAFTIHPPSCPWLLEFLRYVNADQSSRIFGYFTFVDFKIAWNQVASWEDTWLQPNQTQLQTNTLSSLPHSWRWSGSGRVWGVWAGCRVCCSSEYTRDSEDHLLPLFAAACYCCIRTEQGEITLATR